MAADHCNSQSSRPFPLTPIADVFPLVAYENGRKNRLESRFAPVFETYSRNFRLQNMRGQSLAT